MKTFVLKNQRGFSLIEAIVAMVVLTVGLLAVGLMQIGAMKGNTNATSRSSGVAVAQSVMDDLRSLPLDHASLLDPHAGQLDLGAAAAGGPTAVNADHDNGTITTPRGQVYTVFWNIADDFPIDSAKTVRVFVYWNDSHFGLNRAIMTSVIGGLYL
jgi:type IV pilus assembly protein PilV